MRTRLLPEAESDLNAAIEWYEARGKDLGDRFLQAVRTTIAKIERHPEAFPRAHQDFHRALVPRFPYAIVFDVSRDLVTIYAVYHAARDPDIWKRTLDRP